ncbi:MAG: ATP-dependent DNA helicase RecG [Muribaculaceae bacterium]|nr:ATP-dependent DNA helicase RecG [Muribaculaceae bacterium]
MFALKRFDIQYVKGIGPERGKLLTSELGIRTAFDLLRHYPTGYIDRTKTYSIRSLHQATGEFPSLQLRGRFVSFNIIGEGASMRLIGLFTDGTATIDCVWFRGVRETRKRLATGREYVLFGKPSYFHDILQMTHPEVDPPETADNAPGVRAVYPLTEKLRQRNLGSKALHTAIVNFLNAHKTPLRDPLPPSVIQSLGLLSIDEAIRNIHFPQSPKKLERAKLRLKFEELFYIQTDMLMRSRQRKSMIQGYIMPHIGKWFNDFYHNCLPFDLTGAQKRVIKEIRADIISGRQMNRLVQGDVGSGKTLVALMSMLLAIDNGYQACLMAPTEILATQHYETISNLAAKIGLNVKLLTGSTRTKQRRLIDEGLRDGSIHILVGTHAVIEEKVVFNRLGFAVIDEQHRFGVAQRARLWQKSDIPPHVLVMTATPIPRTLAMTVYGDLDVSVIDELPPGRKPVSTVLRYDEQRTRVINGIRTQLAAGHQVYIVYPLVKENEKLDLKSVTEGFEAAQKIFAPYKVALVHGKMKSAEKDQQMSLFASGEAAILVATTVIEVGVNVPNATTMVIENAERFGLSQLHQLRGRVGRGGDRSHCILMSKHNIGNDTRKRLELMTSTTDGFIIAEADMQMRGPGDIEGTAQSGLPFDLKIANLAHDGQIIQMARRAAEALLDSDPSLSANENRFFASALASMLNRETDWSRIS